MVVRLRLDLRFLFHLALLHEVLHGGLLSKSKTFHRYLSRRAMPPIAAPVRYPAVKTMSIAITRFMANAPVRIEAR
jgi:hypothetical protein